MSYSARLILLLTLAPWTAQANPSFATDYPSQEHKRQDHEKDRSRSTLRNRVEYHRSNGRVVWGEKLYVDQFRWHVQAVELSRRVVWGKKLYVDQLRWHVQAVELELSRRVVWGE